MRPENFKFEGGQKRKVSAHLKLTQETNVISGAEAIAEIRKHKFVFFLTRNLYTKKGEILKQKMEREREKERQGFDALSA